MFELIDLSEAEIYGGPTAGHIKLKSIIEWMRKVGADQNAKYLKCLDWRTNHIDVNNIVDVTCSENIVHKSMKTTETFAHAVKIAFKEETSAPAMTVAEAANLFEAVVQKCEEEGVDLADVEVFVQNPQDKLTYFSWYYDEGTDTAVLIKNMSPRKAAEFLKNGADAVIEQAAKSSKTLDKYVDELAKIQEQMEKLKARQDAVYKNMETVSESEDEDGDDGECKDGKCKDKSKKKSAKK